MGGEGGGGGEGEEEGEEEGEGNEEGEGGRGEGKRPTMRKGLMVRRRFPRGSKSLYGLVGRPAGKISAK